MLCCAVVCSTTGNGDSPENADAFWRQIKKRTLPKTHYEGLPFSVLGLGDTNYDKFCHMGKSIDKRLGELGGRRLFELHCADEPTNLEEVVEEWKLKAIASVKELEESLRGGCAESTLQQTSQCGVAEAVDELTISGKTCASVLPEGIKCALEVWNLLGIDGLPSTPPLPKLLPTGSAAVAPDPVEILGDAGSDDVGGDNTVTNIAHAKIDDKTLENSPSEWTVENPFLAPIISAKYLTTDSTFDQTSESHAQWGDEKKVVEAVLSLGDSGITYEPGDSLAVCCPNPQDLAELVLRRLNEGNSGTVLTMESIVRWKNRDPCTLGEILLYKYEP